MQVIFGLQKDCVTWNIFDLTSWSEINITLIGLFNVSPWEWLKTNYHWFDDFQYVPWSCDDFLFQKIKTASLWLPFGIYWERATVMTNQRSVSCRFTEFFPEMGTNSFSVYGFSMEERFISNNVDNNKTYIFLIV